MTQPEPGPEPMPEHDVSTQHLLDQLRQEALDVKECFTTFVFQSSTVAAAALGFVFLNIQDSPYVALTAAPAILVLMIVCRIGVFKFTTANRNFGYQLHLARMEGFLRSTDSEESRERIRAIIQVDWEAALRAWRVVQVAVFRAIYRTPKASGLWGRIAPEAYRTTDKARHLIDRYRDGVVEVESEQPYPWWDPELLTKLHQRKTAKRHEESLYYTGTYLRDMLAALHAMQWLLLAPVAYVAVAPGDGRTTWIRGSFGLLAVLGATVVGLRQVRIARRRAILENEALSIHSCAITWAYVAALHVQSVNDGPSLYFHYTQRLARACSTATEDAFNLPTLTRLYLFTGALHPHLDTPAHSIPAARS